MDDEVIWRICSRSVATLPILFLTQIAFAAPDLEWISSHHQNCLTQHLNEAVQVNRTRSKFYARLSKGRTNSVFNKLIFLDQTGLIFSPYFDHLSKKTLSKNGLPLLCEVIPSMLPTLGRPVIIESPIPVDHFIPISISKLTSDISKTDHSQSLNPAQVVIKKVINELEREPRFNCLTRQFVRSMDLLIDVAKESTSENANRFAWQAIQASLLELKFLVKIDQEAAPFQAEGIPIVCNEIPELP